jgi:hypothetical protein
MLMWSLDYGICGVLKDSKYISPITDLRCLESLCDLEHPGQIWYIWPSESFILKGYTKNDMFSINMCSIFINIHYLSMEFEIEDMNWKRFSIQSKLSWVSWIQNCLYPTYIEEIQYERIIVIWFFRIMRCAIISCKSIRPDILKSPRGGWIGGI